MEDVLKRVSRLQAVITRIATEFINIPVEEFESYIDKSLEVVGTHLEVDRAYLFRYDFEKGIMKNTHEWCAPGISPKKDHLQAVPIDTFPEWTNTHKRGEAIHIPSVSSLGDGPLKEILSVQSIRSLITIPLLIDGDCWGFVGFDSVLKERQWSDDEQAVLMVLGEVYNNLEKFRRSELEKSELQSQLHQAQRLESIGKLAGGVAHDLNNLLTPILGYGELLLGSLKENDPTRRSVEQIVKAGNSAKKIVQQLLAFSRKQTLEMRPIDINKVLTDIKQLLMRTIREDIRIEFELSPDLPMIEGDEGQLEQVIMNLAVNAQDAMPEGGVLTFETAVAELDEEYASSHQGVKPGEYVMLAVTDTGCGMDQEAKKHIFEPFFTTKAKYEGTGLGLATVYGIVKQHQGNIWVYSEPGKGTTFKIYLPISSIPRIQRDHGRSTISPVRSSGHETILIVEDDDAVRELAAQILKGRGYKVIEACNPKEALKILDQHKKRFTCFLRT